jgi:Acetyltransferase (GNAT) family
MGRRNGRHPGRRPCDLPAATARQAFRGSEPALRGPRSHAQGVASALLEAATRSAAANDLDLFLDVTDHLRAARALYERAGFRLVTTTEADWTAPDGRPVTLHRYASNFRLRSQSENPPDLKVRKSSDMGSHAVVTAPNSTA